MGCCLSTPNSITSDEKQLQQQSMKDGSDMYYVRDNKAPPPSSMEEESVKEVLSETPITKQPELQQPVNYRKFNSGIVDQKPAPAQAKASGNQVNHHHPVTEEISEVSEICSLSESVSTTFTEKRDEYYESELKQQRLEKSPVPANKYSNSKPRSFSGELTNGNRQRSAATGSPQRRSDPSPGRRNASPNSTKDGNFRQRRDPGESSGRRSRSPVTRVDRAGANGGNRSSMGRSPSAKRSSGKSPGRVRAAAAPPPSSQHHHQEVYKHNNRHVDDEEEHLWKQQQLMRQETNSNNNSNNDNAANESLENPLVSLECFIFL